MIGQRRMRTVLGSLVAIGWAAAGATAANGEAFEGTVRQISLSMPTAGLRSAADKLEPEQVFAISDEKLAELAHAPGSGAQITKTEIRIDGAKFRVDMVINGKDGYMLVDSATDTTAFVIPADKMYLELTRADREAAAKKQDAERKAAEMLRQQSEKLPAADRERLQAALGPTPAPTVARSEPKLQPLDEVGIVNDAPSAEFEMRDGSVVSRAWVTQAHPELLAAFRAATKSQQSLRERQPTPMERFAEAGLPMRVQTINGDRYEQIELVEITSQALPDDLFQVPSGFTKVDPKATPAAAPAAAPAKPSAP
jgi:hypothetical protein